MPKQKKENKLSDKEQSERFKQTAQELDIDTNNKDFEKAFDKIVRTNSPKVSHTND